MSDKKTHRIRLSQVVYYEVDIAADTREDALNKARAAIEDDSIEDYGVSECDNGSFEIDE
jgi:hypothetical protein